MIVVIIAVTPVLVMITITIQKKAVKLKNINIVKKIMIIKKI